MRYVKASLMILILTTIIGCASVVPSTENMVFPQSKKIRLAVELQLSVEYQHAEKKVRGITISIGDALSVRARNVTQSVFEYMIDNQKPSDDMVDAVLIPRIVFMEDASGMWAWNPAVTTIAVEWKLEDPASNVIWAQTITGEAKSITGYGGGDRSWDKMLQQRIDDAIKDLFNQTHKELSSSPEIIRYANNTTAKY